MYLIYQKEYIICNLKVISLLTIKNVNAKINCIKQPLTVLRKQEQIHLNLMVSIYHSQLGE